MTKSSEHEARTSLEETLRKERLAREMENFLREYEKEDVPLDKKDGALLILYVVAGFALAIYLAFVLIQWKGLA